MQIKCLVGSQHIGLYFGVTWIMDSKLKENVHTLSFPVAEAGGVGRIGSGW